MKNKHAGRSGPGGRGALEKARWTRLRAGYRTGRGLTYEVERFEPEAALAAAFLRDQTAYFRRLGHELVSLEVTQATGFTARRLVKPGPSRHWRADGFRLVVDAQAGVSALEAAVSELFARD